MANETSTHSNAFPFGSGNTGHRILARGITVSNDTWATRLNNNDLVIGPTGSGKTRNYVKPNLLQCNESVIVSDTKGSLVHEIGPVLARHGYRVMRLDFTNVGNGLGYNPFDFIGTERNSYRPNEQNINRMACALCPVESEKEPFWDYAAQMYMSALIAFVMERVTRRERTLTTVARMIGQIKSGKVDAVLQDLIEEDPDSCAAKKYQMFSAMSGADKMSASIIGIMAEKLDTLVFAGASRMYEASERIDFKSLGTEKTALFLTVSDTDRSMDRLVNLFYTQALQTLCSFADSECLRGALPVPVRLYLDDFATNCTIPDFDKTISVIRSRNVSVSVILQSLTQLEAMYGSPRASTIVNGCDHVLYLGGRDLGTAEYVGCMANVPRSRVLSMPLDKAYLVETGRQAGLVDKYRLEEHPLYHELPEVTDWLSQLEWELVEESRSA